MYHKEEARLCLGLFGLTLASHDVGRFVRVLVSSCSGDSDVSAGFVFFQGVVVRGSGDLPLLGAA